MSLLSLLALTACSDDVSEPLGESYGSADTASGDADTDTDTDSDTDADTDTDTDVDTDVADTGSVEGDTGNIDTGEVECDTTTPTTLFLSPDDSNSASSPAQIKEAVLAGWDSLRGVPIRTWEFFNYYHFDYEPPADDGLAVAADLARLGDDELVLQLAVTSPVVSLEDRRPLNMVLVLDTSGSMAGTPLDMLKESCRAIAASLKEGDVVSMVEWSTENAVRLEAYAVSGPDDPMLLAEIEALEDGGGTNLSAGLAAGYDIADRTWDAERINRVVLISDGGANVGVTDEELIGARAGGWDEDGIYLVGVGVGTASTYDDALMDTVTDLGRGASLFVGTTESAWDQLGPEAFPRVMDVAARGVEVELDLPPGFEIVRFSGEEYATAPDVVEPQHLAPDDTMVFYQTLRTCAPDQAGDDAPLTVTARWTDPLTFEERSATLETTFAAAADSSPQLDKGAAIYAYAEGLKACQAGSRDEWPGLLGEARAAIERAEASNPGDPDLEEMLAVVEQLGG